MFACFSVRSLLLSYFCLLILLLLFSVKCPCTVQESSVFDSHYAPKYSVCSCYLSAVTGQSDTGLKVGCHKTV